jgi:D-3-phosphoglycerate dehydrogenase
MRVLVWSSESSRARARGDAYEVAAERDALFADSDVLSLHLHLVDVTRGIVTARDLARIKPSALLGTPAAPV